MRRFNYNAPDATNYRRLFDLPQEIWLEGKRKLLEDAKLDNTTIIEGPEFIREKINNKKAERKEEPKNTSTPAGFNRFKRGFGFGE